MGWVRDVQRGIAVQGSRSEERMSKPFCGCTECDRSHCGDTINWPQRIHNEFGAPASIIIASFIRDGYSRKLTAAALGISRTALMNYCRTFGIQWPDPKTYRAECRAAFTGERRGYSNNPHGHNQWTGRKDTHDFNGKEIQGRARETR